MKVLAIDPAFNSIGWVFMVDGELISRGCLHPPKPNAKAGKMEDDFRRAAALCRELNFTVRFYNPDKVCLELPGGCKSSRAARMLGMATALVAAVTNEAQSDTHLVSPFAVKRHTGLSSKADIIKWALARQPKLFDGVLKRSDNEHIADAYAVYEVWRDRAVSDMRGTS